MALFLAKTFNAIRKKDILKKAILPFSKMAIGIGVYTVLLGIYFLITNSFLEFYDAAFAYNFSYSKLSVGGVLESIITSTRRYEISLVMILGMLIATISFLKKRINFVGLLLLFWIPIELYFSNMSGKLFAHYYMMWIPIIVLSTAYILDYFNIKKVQKEKQWILLGITIFLFFQIPVFSTLKSYKSFLFSKENKTKVIASYIHSNFKDNTILIWGNYSSIYNLIQKKAVVPYFYQTFFKVKNNVTRAIIKDFTQKFIKNPPGLLIDTKTPSLLFLDQSNRDKIDNYQKENLQAYFNFVHQNYRLKETIEGVDFYVKK